MQAYLIIKIFDVLEIQSKKYRFFFSSGVKSKILNIK